MFFSFVHILVGPSSDPYGLSIVDSIKIYVQSKTEFGYKEDSQEQSQEESSPAENVAPLMKSPLLNSEMYVSFFGSLPKNELNWIN